MGKNEMINVRFYDLLDSGSDYDEVNDMSGDEIAADVIKRAGLVVQ